MLRNFLKGIGQLILVGLPSLFVLLWTVSAPLVRGAEVFFITLIQLLFLIVFIGWIRWNSSRGESSPDPQPAEA